MDVVCLARLLLVLHWALPIHGQSPFEPTCTSRYDYEHKVLHTIVKMEIEQESLREQIGNVIRDAESEITQNKEDITELQKAVEDKNVEIKELVQRVEDLSGNAATGCAECKDDRATAGYTYKDELAQAACVALGRGHVYAVRRKCSSSGPDCASTCSSLGKTCVNALHVYARPTLKPSDTGKAGLHMYRYNNCGGGCGPNFCCCQG